MRKVLIVATVGLMSVGYFVSPVAAKPIANCWKNLLICEQTGRRNGYSVRLTDTICSASYKKCDENNASKGYDYMGRRFGRPTGPKGGKKNLAAPAKVGIPAPVTAATGAGKNAQAGTVKVTTPASKAATPTDTVKISAPTNTAKIPTPTNTVRITAPRPTTSSGAVLGEPRQMR